MRASLRYALLCATLSWPAGQAVAGGASDAPASSPEGAAWSFGASAYGFLVPDSRDYLNPNLTADRGGLHLEARYNYEALETGSAWVGWNFELGDALLLQMTPMLGGVFGSVNGIAPGFLLSLGYRQLALSSQGEYLFDAAGRTGDFLYTWSELSWLPAEWFRTGLAIQRTRAYESSLDVQRGFLVAFSWREVELGAYVFNPGWTTPTWVVAVAGGS
jgi:hypothetical protein